MNVFLRSRITKAFQASSMHGWLVIDRDFNVVFVNDAFCRLRKKNEEDLTGKYLPAALFDGNKQDAGGVYHDPLLETMDTEREFPAVETCMYNAADQSYIWFLASTFILRDQDGRPEYGVGIYIGIDKFKVIEKKLNNINMDIIKAFCKALGLRDSYTKLHSEHVAALMVELAEYMNLPTEEVTKAYLAGIVHDIGKIGVPERILNKAAQLTDEEYTFVKRHPAKGADILSDIEGFTEITKIVLHHHERYDGLGYPEGLAGEDIPYISRMLAICDAYDAMTSERCYRKPYSLEYALKEIERCSGTQFDPEISRCFTEFMYARNR